MTPSVPSVPSVRLSADGGNPSSPTASSLTSSSLPPFALFADVEAGCVPLLIPGFASAWPASTAWDPARGGLDRLRALAGDARVEAMVAPAGSSACSSAGGPSNASVFCGDLGRRTPSAGLTMRRL